jgi:effector-binding domain-containing protein
VDYEFDIVEIEPVTLAVTEAIVKQPDIPKRIIGLFDIVYTWLREADVQQTGHNYAIYCMVADGMLMQVGFPVSGRFTDGGAVQCIELRGGKAAHTTHRGEYSGLHDAHAQLQIWCSRQSLSPGGLFWEVYSDWHDDPEQLETDIYHQLG